MKDIFVLHDGTRLPIEDGSFLRSIIHIADDEAAAIEACKKITLDNLTHVQIVSNENAVGDYYNVQIHAAPTRATNENGTVTVVISLREETSVEARLAAIEEEQEIQNAAIDYLAMD